MKSILNKIQTKIHRNLGLVFLIILMILSLTITQSYNLHKRTINQNYINLINNIYFKKSLNHILDNLEPKYLSIEHKISSGETFNKILSQYQIPKSEINKIKKKLFKKSNLNNLKTNQVIKFTIDKSENNIITTFLFPISRTEKIQLNRNFESGTFEKKKLLLV